MTIGNALTFIKRGLEDSTLRERLNSAASTSALQQVLADEQITFSAHAFDEAFHHRLTQCREEEQMQQLKEFKLWWDLLAYSLEPAACANQCSGCCG